MESVSKREFFPQGGVQMSKTFDKTFFLFPSIKQTIPNTRCRFIRAAVQLTSHLLFSPMAGCYLRDVHKRVCQSVSARLTSYVLPVQLPVMPSLPV